MAKTRIQLFTKDYTFIGKPIIYETTFIPRVGEIIDGSIYLNLKENYNFFVFSVVYRMTDEGFLPFIAAREWYKGLRYEELENYGWLTPTSFEPPEHAYDEDFYFD